MFESLKNLVANDIVSLIAIIALLSPPITALIDNGFKLFSKQIDNKRAFYDNEFNHKRELFENFLAYTGIRPVDSSKYIEELRRSYFVLSPYIPKNEFVYFREYCNLVEEVDSPEKQEKLTMLLNDHIVPCIKKELRRYKPLRK